MNVGYWPWRSTSRRPKAPPNKTSRNEQSSLHVLKATAHGWIHLNSRAYIMLYDPRGGGRVKPDYEIAGYSFYHNLEEGTYLFHSGSGNRTYYYLFHIKKEIKVSGKGLQYLGSFRIVMGLGGAKDIARAGDEEKTEDLRELEQLIKKTQAQAGDSKCSRFK